MTKFIVSKKYLQDSYTDIRGYKFMGYINDIIDGYETTKIIAYYASDDQIIKINTIITVKWGSRYSSGSFKILIKEINNIQIIEKEIVIELMGEILPEEK